jgi:hypothetical protein
MIRFVLPQMVVAVAVAAPSATAATTDSFVVMQ